MPLLFNFAGYGRSGADQANDLMARPAGLEPATTRLEGGCSIQLSYECVLFCIKVVLYLLLIYPNLLENGDQLEI